MVKSNSKYDFPKTLGPQSARLVTALHERGGTIFTHADAETITGLRAASARNLITGLVNRGLATRLKPGLFILVPFELGREREYLGNPYPVARALVGTHDYYISHASAMELHQMVTQPQLVVFASAPKAIRPRTVLGTEFRFVRCKRSDLFGIVDHWVTKTERIRVSDLERTVIDGLKQPEFCGGISEVAKGYWMRRDAMDPGKLVDYALRIDVGAVVRRLGFLLELFEAAWSEREQQRLRARLTSSYMLLDPTLPAVGAYQARWRLRLNVDPVELHSIVRT